MPYRRLPNTDLSRIAALKRITDMGGVKYKDVQVISFRTIQEVSMTLSRFQKAQRQYQQCYDSFIKLNKTFKTETQNARMYISHFIQVMNLAIQRGELKKEIKTSYGLDPKSSAVPDLTSEQNILDWGDKVIRGEEARTMKGGLPIYNPTIAKVKVHYDIFADHLFNIRVLRENVARTLDEITKMRPAVDDIILDIWNQVEQTYDDLPFDLKIEKCKQFGLIYYFRASEKAKLKAESIQNSIEF